MHLRLPLWLALFAFVTLGAVRAQTPSSGAASMPPGQIVAKQVTGRVVMTLNGTTAPLHNDEHVSQSATIVTQHDSSVILVFSNGATTQLGGDTTLSIDEFLQDPFSQDINVGALTTEPTRSRTKLRLTKGELLGKVAHLRISDGSSFTVETPVGAAGIRGTTFRIVFRPSGTGQAFAVFSLSTVEGNVHFQQNSSTATPPSAPGQPPTGGTQPSTPGAPATPAGGVAVTGGQEVVVTVSVNVNAQTGQVAVTAPPVITSTEPISVQTQAALVQQVQALVTTAATTTFTPPPAPATTGATGTSTSSTSGDKKDTSSDKSSGQSSSDDSSTGTGSASTTSTSSTSNDSTPPAQPPGAGDLGSAAPGVTSTLPNLTPLAGKGSQ